MRIWNGWGRKRLWLLDFVDWFNVALDKDKWRAVVNIPFPQNGNFLAISATISFFRGT
jgi:hypothetical protein